MPMASMRPISCASGAFARASFAWKACAPSNSRTLPPGTHKTEGGTQAILQVQARPCSRSGTATRFARADETHLITRPGCRLSFAAVHVLLHCISQVWHFDSHKPQFRVY